MQVLYERCAGLDVHKRTVVACLRTPGPGARRQAEVRTFGTATAEVEALATWLRAAGCTHVAMESTGVYWQPVFNVLEGSGEVVLVNARHVKALPGRKTDVKDCAWLAELLEHGLLKGSFIPPAPIRALRQLTRYRKTLVQQRAAEVNRVQKLLEMANIKLASVATDVLGASGRAILAALAAGERDAERLATLARGTLRRKHEALRGALAGRVTDQDAFVLGQLLEHIAELDRHVAACEARIEAHLRPFGTAAVERLQTIPGVGRCIAQVLVAEVGLDMQRFPTAAHLASWAGMCPGNNESAGQRHSGRTRKGNPWLRTALLEAAWAATRTRRTYLGQLYARVARRRGGKRAAVAVGHSILVAVWHMLSRGVPYAELGPDHFDRLQTARLTRHYVRRLEQLGLHVTIEPQAAIA